MHRALSRPVCALAATTATAAVGLLFPGGALASHGVTSALGVNSAGVIGNDQSNHADLTPDGRYVSFASSASNLVPGDTNNVGDVFVRDRRSGVTERVSVGLKSAQGNGDSNVLGISTNTAISDDGRYVAFKSEATNLVRGDRNGLTDVFVRDRVAGTTSLVSVDGAGNAAGGDEPAISPDGRYVAFVTAGIDADFTSDVYLRDRVAGTTTRISVAFGGGAPSNSSSSPAVTAVAGAAIVAFQSAADNLVPLDGDEKGDIFLRDLGAPSPFNERVSVNGLGMAGTGGSSGARGASISNDGRYVAFGSDAQNFTDPAQTGPFMDVFVRDRQFGTTTLASPSTTGGETDGQSEGAHISAGGGFVSFQTFASNIVTVDRGEAIQPDAVVRDLSAGSTELTSVTSDDANILLFGFDAQAGSGPVSDDGLVSLFGTNADNLNSPTIGFQVYARDRRPTADLSLTLTDIPDPVTVKGALTYTLQVTNDGGGSAPGAAVVDTLPAGVTVTSMSPGCTNAAGTVTCELGTLAAAATTSATITVAPKARGVLTNSASVGSNAIDPDGSDNTASTTTTVVR
jgi:uncharacterized repeat protein (TIGR01451 family)